MQGLKTPTTIQDHPMRSKVERLNKNMSAQLRYWTNTAILKLESRGNTQDGVRCLGIKTRIKARPVVHFDVVMPGLANEDHMIASLAIARIFTAVFISAFTCLRFLRATSDAVIVMPHSNLNPSEDDSCPMKVGLRPSQQ